MFVVVDTKTGEVVQYLTRPLTPAQLRRRSSWWMWAWCRLAKSLGWE